MGDDCWWAVLAECHHSLGTAGCRSGLVVGIMGIACGTGVGFGGRSLRLAGVQIFTF